MVFKESQKIDNLGFRIMYLVTLLPVGFAFYEDYQSKGGVESTDLFIWAGTMLFMVGIYFLVFESKAHMQIDSSGIHYQYKPIVWSQKTIEWNEISSTEIKKISPLSDYGGWGYRIGFGKGAGIIMAADDALIIHKKNGKSFTITTKRKNDLERVLEYWQKEN